MQYRRAFIPNGSWFFTIVINRRGTFLTDSENIVILREAFKQVKEKYPFTIEAIVVMPDHLHCIWTLPKDDSNFSTRWRLIKTWFTKHSDSNLRPVWQQRYWEHLLRDEDDFNKDSGLNNMRNLTQNFCFRLNALRRRIVTLCNDLIAFKLGQEGKLRSVSYLILSPKHVDYIHYNPVKHGYVNAVADWHHSSFHKFVRQGIYPKHWGNSDIDFTGIGNE